MSDVEPDAGIEAKPIQWLPLDRGVRAEEITVVVDGYVENVGSEGRSRKGTVEVHEVIKIRSLRIARSMLVIGTGQEGHGTRKLPR